MSQTQVSVVIVNYNTKDLTAAAVRCVFEKTKDIIFEIIAVDNASTDGSLQALKKEFGEKITLIESSVNLGFGGANNLGIKSSKGEFVFLLNSDTVLINNAIYILYEFMKQNPQAGVCGGNLYNKDGKPTYSFCKNTLRENESALIKIFKSIKQRLSGKMTDFFNYSDKALEVDGIIGADMMIRKSVLDATGLFDEDFFLYLEESELTARIKKSGFLSYCIPQAKIVHLEGASFKTPHDYERKARAYSYSSFLYYEKVYGKEAVKKHYKERLRFVRLLRLFSLGLLSKECSKRKRIIEEEYAKWAKNRK
ncbi:MAG: glycosyltransferase family 2 protein [Elusimicrobiota bacterium]|jgi:GT2 family glycosyltransferase|nr:glycosyltransferase family 2 protein [Elusimicrobiota bacterium]